MTSGANNSIEDIFSDHPLNQSEPPIEDCSNDEAGLDENQVSGPQEMRGQMFAKFWGVDAYDLVSMLASKALKVDCSPIKTPIEIQEPLIAAIMEVEHYVDEYPWLAWMRNPTGSPLLIIGVAAFYKAQGIKQIIEAVEYKKADEKAKEKAKRSAENNKSAAESDQDGV